MGEAKARKMQVIKVTGEDVAEAAENWLTVVPEDRSLYVFGDFIDPVRQTDLRYLYHWDGDTLDFEIGAYTEVNIQIARRIEMLLSPHFHTILKANWHRVEHAKKSWGKKYPRK